MKITVVLFLLIPPMPLFSGPIEDLQPGEWYEVPNSHLESVKPDPLPFGGGNGFQQVMGAWNGGAYDTKRDRFLVWGGGHCDYYGNEIYAFDMNTLQWSRLTEPTPDQYIQPCYVNQDVYGDSNPAPQHTYDGLEYLPDPVDAMIVSGGANVGAGPLGGTFMFRFATNTWEHMTKEPDWRLGNESDVDPVNGHFLMRGKYLLMEFDPRADTWTTRSTQSYGGDGGWWSSASTGALDTKRRLMVFVGDARRYAGLLTVFNLNTNQWSYPAATGDTSIMNAYSPGYDYDAPGVAYDPVSDRMVAWNGGTDVYLLDMDTWVWTRHAPAVTNTVVPSASNRNGTYGRFRYVPSKNVFVCVNQTYENVFIYRLTSGSGTQANPAAPAGPALFSVYPNPAKSGETIRFQVAAGSGASGLSIFNVHGQKVAALPINKKDGAISWRSGVLPAGIYLAELKARGKSSTQKLFFTN